MLDLGPFFSEKEIDWFHDIARKCTTKGEKIYGVPWMMAPYVLIFYNQLLQEANIIIPEEELDWAFIDLTVRRLTFRKMEGKSEKQYYGFCTYFADYSRPLWSIIHGDGGTIIDEKSYNMILEWNREAGALPQNMMNYSFDEAWQLFAIQGRVGLMLGNVRSIYRMRSLQQMGKGFDITVKAVPADGKKGLFTDQVAAYGIMKSEYGEKVNLCVSFLKMLVEDEAQVELKSIGAFPVIASIKDIYSDDLQMSLLESSLKNYTYSPADTHWRKQGEDAQAKIKFELEKASGFEE